MIASAQQIERIRKHNESIGALKPGERFGLRGVKGRAVVADANARVLTLIINTDDVDSDDEVVVPGGLDFDPFRQNGKVFLDHRYDFEHTIGALRSVSPFPNKASVRGWLMTMSVISGLRNPLADDVLTAAREIGIGASIGFIPKLIEPPSDRDPERYKAARAVVRAAAVFEVSLAMMPSNLSCQDVEAPNNDPENYEPMMASLGALVTKGKLKPESAKRLGWREPARLAMAPRRLRMAV